MYNHLKYVHQFVKEYSSEYSDSVIKVKDTSETGGETFTKFSGFWGVIPRIPHAKYGGDQILGEEVGKLNL